MDNKLIDGKKISKELIEQIRLQIEINQLKLKLAVIQVGDNPASSIYIKYKQKACESIGIDFQLFKYPENIEQKEIENKIKQLNSDEEITGILIQLPLPNHLDKDYLINSIDPKKDVDGLTIYNQGKTTTNYDCTISPATPKGIIKLLDVEKINLQGALVCVIGRSNLVGKPLTNLLINRQATVISCNSKTKNLQELTKLADIIIVAAGQPNLISKDNLNKAKSQIIIDVGANTYNGHYCGDVNFDDVIKNVEKITPVPGGVGPMTIWGLLDNLYTLKIKQKKEA